MSSSLTDLRRVLRVLRAAEPEPGRFSVGLAFGVLSGISTVALLAASAYLIAASALRPPILTLSLVIVSVRAFALGKAFFRYLERLASHDAAFRMLGRLRAVIYARLRPGAPVNLQRIGRGDLLTRLVEDVDQLQDMPLRILQPLAISLVVTGLSVVTIGLISPTAALVLVACLALAAVLGAWIPARFSLSAAERMSPTRGELGEGVLEFATNLSTLQAFEASGEARSRIDEVDRRLRGIRSRLSVVAGLGAGVLSLASGSAVLWTAAVTVNELTWSAFSGPFLALLVLTPIAVFEVYGAAHQTAMAWQKLRPASRRLGEVLDGSPEVALRAAPHEATPEPAPPFTGLSVRELAVTWPGAMWPAVSDVTFDLAPGSTLLITGASGSGKSTVAYALVGFLAPSSGSYLVDGQDATAMPAERLRSIVGLCEQSPHVFDTDVRQNLKLARPDADDAELWQALEAVGLAAEVRARDGLDTAVGVGGARLSGGQVQRLALARAILARFPVIVFDEPTANVPPESGQALMRGLLDAAKTAAHRPAVVLISHDRVPAELVDHHLSLASPDRVGR